MDSTSDPFRNEYDVLDLVRKLQKKCTRQEQELAKLRGELAGRNVTSIKRAITITSTVEFDEFFPNRVPKSALANAGISLHSSAAYKPENGGAFQVGITRGTTVPLAKGDALLPVNFEDIEDVILQRQVGLTSVDSSLSDFSDEDSLSDVDALSPGPSAPSPLTVDQHRVLELKNGLREPPAIPLPNLSLPSSAVHKVTLSEVAQLVPDSDVQQVTVRSADTNETVCLYMMFCLKWLITQLLRVNMDLQRALSEKDGIIESLRKDLVALEHSIEERVAEAKRKAKAKAETLSLKKSISTGQLARIPLPTSPPVERKKRASESQSASPQSVEDESEHSSWRRRAQEEKRKQPDSWRESKSEVEYDELAKSPSNEKLFDPSTDEGALVTKMDKKRGKVVASGTLPKLVQWLTMDGADLDYLNDFLLTMPLFSSPVSVLSLLRLRFATPKPAEFSNDEYQIMLKNVRLRVFNVLKTWLTTYFPEDFEGNKRHLGGLMKVVTAMEEHDLENPAQVLRQRLKDLKEGPDTLVEPKPVFKTKAPEPILRRSASQKGSWQDLSFPKDFDPEELARQLTLLEHELLRRIRPRELTGNAWQKGNKAEIAPNVTAMIAWTNSVIFWVATSIVTLEEAKQRTATLRAFIELASALRRLNNFNGVFEIISGLRHASVYRLKETWLGLPDKSTEMYTALKILIAPDNHYRAYREALQQTTGTPTLPYLGVYLSDLTYIQESNTQNDGLINFNKFHTIAAIIRQMQQCQHNPFNFEPLPLFQSFLKNTDRVDERTLMQLSNVRETVERTISTKDVRPKPGRKAKRGAALTWSPKRPAKDE